MTSVDSILNHAQLLGQDDLALLIAKLMRHASDAQVKIEQRPFVTIQKPIRTVDKAVQQISGAGVHLTDEEIDDMRFEYLMRKHGGDRLGFV